jgi:hypothetical protein
VAKWLRFLWTPERQEIAVDGEVFAHPQTTNTSPSHDLCHIVAAASGLSWKPRGPRDAICVAEFNAVLLEHLLGGVLEAVLLGHVSPSAARERALEQGRWFVEDHYAPFPATFETAFDHFRAGLDTETVVRLSPIFFRLRAYELEHDDYRERSFSGRFCSSFPPEIDAGSREPQTELAQQLAALGCASQIGRPDNAVPLICRVE